LKKRILILLSICISVLIFLGIKTTEIQAAVTPAPVNYSVSPEPADNQIDKTISYYDLKVTPGQKETLKFKINNNDTNNHTYSIMINRATTDINGVIDYTEHNSVPEDKLNYNVENLVDYPRGAFQGWIPAPGCPGPNSSLAAGKYPRAPPCTGRTSGADVSD